MNPCAHIRAAVLIISCSLFCMLPVFAAGTELYNQTMAMEREGRLDEAITAIHSALEVEPANDLYLATAGHLEYNRGRHANALKHASHAIAVNPVGWYYVVAARAAFALGKFPESRVYAAEAMRFGKTVLGEANYSTVETILVQFEPYAITLAWPIAADRVVRDADGYAVTVTVPLPTLPYQSTRVRVNGAQITRDYEMDGNRLLDLVAESPERIEVVTEFLRAPLDYTSALSTPVTAEDVPEDVAVYLGPSHKVHLDSSRLQTIAAEQKGATHAETVRNIVRWMNTNLQYEISDFAEAGEVVERGYGECWGWSSVFTALARLNGIPARNVWGMTHAPGFAPEGYLKGHTWAEFYLPGTGWIPVDPQFPGMLGTLPSHYLRVAHSTILDGWGAVKNLPDTTQILERSYPGRLGQ
jgi:transglutaminase-like putative cysteine protease